MYKGVVYPFGGETDIAKFQKNMGHCYYGMCCGGGDFSDSVGRCATGGVKALCGAVRLYGT